MNDRSDIEGALRALAGRDVFAARAGFADAVLANVGLIDAYATLPSPIGPLLVAWSSEGIAAVHRGDDAAAFARDYAARTGRRIGPVRSVPRSLLGRRPRVDLRGLSPFERAVLEKALEIPAGQVRPYWWIAREIGRPRAVRAVGSALGRNPVPFVIPCHRVVRGDGRIGEYIFGSEGKRALLQAEGVDVDALPAHRLVASDTTGVFCFPTCAGARRITAAHRHTFADAAAAHAAGYRPCKRCRPALAS
jgi:O-6-methylguanine DNA methyltransferase